MHLHPPSYWTSLSSSPTTEYKESVILQLLATHGISNARHILDVGCGFSTFSERLAFDLHALRLTRVDADKAVQVHYSENLVGGSLRIDTVLGTLPKLPPITSADVILCLDVLHEVYSFTQTSSSGIVDRRKGIGAVLSSFKSLREVLAEGGCMAISDAIRPSTRRNLRIEARNLRIARVVREIEANYVSEPLRIRWIGSLVFECDEVAMSIILTQYNKLLEPDPWRWEIEKREVHQYMSRSMFENAAIALGLSCALTIGTPECVRRRYLTDFCPLSGELPETRVVALMADLGENRYGQSAKH